MFAHRYWIWIWYGILALGMIGLVAAVQWGRQTHWKNLDEVLRGFGTILASVGMLLLLYQVADLLGYALLVVALVTFVAAFVRGRRIETSKDKQPNGR